MIFTLENIINSLAGVLTARYPDYPVYASPNQQGTDYPCFFIFFMPSKIEKHMNDRFLRDLGVDIVFVQQRNIVNGNAEIQAIAYRLSGTLITVTCSGTVTSSCTIRTEAPFAATSPAYLWPSDTAPLIQIKRESSSAFRESKTTLLTSLSRLPCTHIYSRFFKSSVSLILNLSPFMESGSRYLLPGLVGRSRNAGSAL